MWLSNLSSGPQYEAQKAYAEYLCDQMGYDFKVVYGDSQNDPDGNLQAVKNGMTSDVVGLILSQDGGVANIMEEYPDLWVVGHNSDFNSIYSDIPQVATSASVKDNETRSVQFWNEPSPILCTLLPNFTERKPLHPKKVQTPVSAESIEMEVRPVHSRKIPLPMLVKLFGTATDVKLLQQ